MRYEDMSLGALMELPDHVFGRRWWSATYNVAGAAASYSIALEGLPERCIVWGCMIMQAVGGGPVVDVRWALGDQVPATQAAFLALDPIFSGFVGRIWGAGALPFTVLSSSMFLPCRQAISPMGRRLVVGVTPSGQGGHNLTAGILVSSMPTGPVPACYL